MNHAPPDFGETLHDWQADPSNWRAGALFRPKGLGATLPGRRLSRRWRAFRFVLTAAITLAAGAMALAALSRVVPL